MMDRLIGQEEIGTNVLMSPIWFVWWHLLFNMFYYVRSFFFLQKMCFLFIYIKMCLLWKSISNYWQFIKMAVTKESKFFQTLKVIFYYISCFDRTIVPSWLLLVLRFGQCSLRPSSGMLVAVLKKKG